MRPTITLADKLLGIMLLAVGSLTAAPTWAQSKVVQIEEHWELRVAQPDTDTSAPQMTMVISPIGDLSGLHFIFILNHVNVPGYEAGGLQAQLWDGDSLLQESVASEIGALENTDEVIRWVHRLTLDEGNLKFAVLNGESDTWGNFGGDELSFTFPTTLQRLNAYKPAVSISESQVSYAENRVVSLVLTKLVWVKDNGQVTVQNAPIPVDTSLDD